MLIKYKDMLLGEWVKHPASGKGLYTSMWYRSGVKGDFSGSSFIGQFHFHYKVKHSFTVTNYVVTFYGNLNYLNKFWSNNYQPSSIEEGMQKIDDFLIKMDKLSKFE